MREEARQSANLFFKLMYVVPLIAIVLFYSLRWVITGRLKPVFLKRT